MSNIYTSIDAVRGAAITFELHEPHLFRLDAVNDALVSGKPVPAATPGSARVWPALSALRRSFTSVDPLRIHRSS